MLDGNVKVGNDLFLFGDGIDQFFGDLVGIEVVQTDPVEVELAQLAQQRRKLMFAVEVRAVARDVLRDNDEFLHARGGKLARLVEKLRHRAAAIAPAQARDHAIGAAVVAALGNAEIGIPWRRG